MHNKEGSPQSSTSLSLAAWVLDKRLRCVEERMTFNRLALFYRGLVVHVVVFDVHLYEQNIVWLQMQNRFYRVLKTRKNGTYFLRSGPCDLDDMMTLS